jgi:hypothetical protein
MNSSHQLYHRFLVLCAGGLLLGVLNSYLILNYWHTLRVEASQKRILADIATIDKLEGYEMNTSAPLVMEDFQADVKIIDGRSAKLRRYLRSLNSPLFDHADLLVEEADKNGYDYRLLVAISLQESLACRKIPEGSHNCWGWGIYGDTVTRFDSYEDAIRTVSAGIKKNYLDKGLITTEQIMKKYTPGSNGSWSRAVRYFFHRIETY